MAFDPITAVADVVGKVLDRVLPDKVAQDAAKAQLAQLALSGELATVAGQLQVNAVEAGNTSTFVAGWRPFIGWICGMALACDYIVRPVLIWACNLAHRPTDFPNLDTTELMPLIMAMLGMGALHVYQDVTNKKNGNGNGTST